MQEIQDLHISGGATLAGGMFKKVHISGRGTFTEPMSCTAMHVSGLSKCHHVQTEDLHISGMLKATEDMHAKKLHVSGKATLLKNLVSENIGVSGMLSCQSVKSEVMSVSGHLKTEGLVEAEKIEVSGRLRNNQTLNVGTLYIKCGCGATRLHDVEAEQIMIKPTNCSISAINPFKVVKQCFNQKAFDVYANCLEADKVEIDQVKAHLVRGGDVVIGPECDIEFVEYHHSISIHKKATVKHVKQI